MGGGGGVVKGNTRTKAKGKEKERYVPSPKIISLVLPRAKLLFCNLKKPTVTQPTPQSILCCPQRSTIKGHAN